MAALQCSVNDGISTLHIYAVATRDAVLLAYPALAVAPTLRESVPQYRATRRDELSKAVKDLQTQNHLLAEIQHALSAAQAAIRVYRDTMKQALAPVSGLPEEILREIFLWAVCTHDKSFSRRRIDLATRILHVSSHWRSVACSVPELWQDIRITPMDSAELFEAWSSRGGLILPDKVSTMTLAPTHMPLGSSIKPPLLATLDRNRVFKTKFEHDVDIDVFFGNLRLWRAWPALRGLRQLTVESIEMDSFTDYDPIDLFVAPFPELEHLELVNLMFSAPAAYPAIPPVVRTLICRQCCMPDIFWDSLHNLEELRLIECHCDDLVELAPEGPCIFPKLLTLVAHNCDIDLLRATFPTMRAPELECLDISIPQEDDIDAITFVHEIFSFLAPDPEWSGSKLKSLRLMGTVEHFLGALIYLGQLDTWSLPSSLIRLELLVEGYEGTPMDTKFAEHTAERCLALLKAHWRNGHILEAFRVSSCLLKSDHLQKYADIGVNVEAVPISASLQY